VGKAFGVVDFILPRSLHSDRHRAPQREITERAPDAL
jgi:hypothetical protein